MGSPTFIQFWTLWGSELLVSHHGFESNDLSVKRIYQIHASSCLNAFFWYLNDLDINNYKWERGDAPTHHRCCVELFSLFFWLFWRCVGCEWKLELHNVNQVKLQMWHQSTLSTMRPGFNTSTTPTPPTILRWQYFQKSWVLFSTIFCSKQI